MALRSLERHFFERFIKHGDIMQNGKERKLYNDNWSCRVYDVADVEKPGVERPSDIDICDFEPVTVPHDALIGDANSHYKSCIVWYAKRLGFTPKSGKRYILYFEGVYMNSDVFVGDMRVGGRPYGYSSFTVELTDHIKSEDDMIYVRAEHLAPNSRWYGGPGINRDVWLYELPKTHIALDSIYIHTNNNIENKWTVDLSFDIDGVTGSAGRIPTEDLRFSFELAGHDGDVIYASDMMPISGGIHTEHSFETDGVTAWDIDDPVLYELKISLFDGDGLDEDPIDVRTQSFGFRTIDFTTDRGFFLNGRHVKLKGVCLHTDGGAIGMAFHKDMALRQLLTMKDMGVNAIRFAHNPPAPGFLELCDEHGMLVMDESFDCWRNGKTRFDYGRFFDEWAVKDITDYIRRDRNHPSVIMWSLGNEIYDTHKDADEGVKTLGMLMDAAAQADPKYNAYPTLCSNYMPWENTQKAADVIKLIGYNYAERLYEKHHKEHPDWIIYGSETASCVQSRGIYHFPLSRALLTDEDRQCSSLGNSTTSWGAKNLEYCVTTERDTDYSLGQFLWSGIDYIGEPTPYHTKNSYFGMADTACFPKDAYYLFKAEWTDVKVSPMIHILPYWDHNPGQMIDVRICSNASEVELFLNNRSLGKRTIDHAHGMQLYADFRIAYEPGELKAVAYDESGNEIATDIKHSFLDVAGLKLSMDHADTVPGEDKLYFVEIGGVDKDGHTVENADVRVRVKVSGHGYLYGLDNGDSTDYDSYKGDTKRMFNGRLLAIVRSDGTGGRIDISADIDKSDIPVRKIELDPDADGPVRLNPDHDSVVFKTTVYPANACGYEISYEITNESGVIIKNACVTDNGDGHISVKAVGDGSMKLRAICRDRDGRVYLISAYEILAEGFGALNFDPYSFVTASLYTDSSNDIGNGNDSGIATPAESDGWVAYANTDFGSGADTVTIPIFELAGDPFDIIFWCGIPHSEGAFIIGRGHYHKPCIWNVYQEQTFKLDKLLKGIQTFAIEIDSHKAHIKGFVFDRLSRVGVMNQAVCADEIYGDTYDVRDDAIYGIGNNVSVVYKDYDLGDDGIGRLTIDGHTRMDNNTVHIIFEGGATKERRIVEFAGSDDFIERSFVIEKVSGTVDITFVFLPGCDFDFKGFRLD